MHCERQNPNQKMLLFLSTTTTTTTTAATTKMTTHSSSHFINKTKGGGRRTRKRQFSPSQFMYNSSNNKSLSSSFRRPLLLGGGGRGGCSNVFVNLCFIFFCCLYYFPILTFSLNLSPIESTILGRRLEEIQTSVKNQYKSVILPTKKDDDDDDDELAKTNTFIFPGAGGVDELVLKVQETIPGSKIIDWKEYRGSILTAAYDGEAVGTAISDLLLSKMINKPNENQQQQQQNQQQPSLHFIGISVGAFCANAAATLTFLAIQQQQQQQSATSASTALSLPNVQLTLLDPFCGRGIFGSNYGFEHFGKYATTALQILNTDDPVPTTNDPLPHCICLDVTNDPRRRQFIPPPGDSMHSWPVAYFARYICKNNDNDNNDQLYSLLQSSSRGSVIKSHEYTDK